MAGKYDKFLDAYREDDTPDLSGYYTESEVDALLANYIPTSDYTDFVNIAGDTMTGGLTISSGGLDVIGGIGLGSGGGVDTNKILNIDHTIVSTTDDYGFFTQLRLNPAGNIGGFHFGGFIGAQVLSGNTANFTGGIRGSAYLAEHYGTGTVNQLFGATFESNNRSTGTVISAMGVNIAAPINSGGGTLTDFDGMFIDRPTAASSNNRALRTAGGLVVFNDFMNPDDFIVRTDNVFEFLFIDGSADSIRIANSSSALIGFYGTAPQSQPTGVAVTAEGIHAALVTLGLITA